MAISAAFPFASHYVDVAGVRMHYVEQGTGDPILFQRPDLSVRLALAESAVVDRHNHITGVHQIRRLLNQG